MDSEAKMPTHFLFLKQIYKQMSYIFFSPMNNNESAICRNLWNPNTDEKKLNDIYTGKYIR